MTRIYEELFIIRPDAPEEEINSLVDQIKGFITAGGGTIDKEEKWGLRKLAYPVNKRIEGFYVLLQFTAEPESVKELERRLRVMDSVLKFLTKRIDEHLKRVEKRKKEREKRAKRKPAPTPVARPAEPAPARPAMPEVPAQPVPEAAAEKES